MRINQRPKIAPVIHVYGAISFLILAILACSDGFRQVDHTELAPQDLSGLDLSHKDICCFDFSGKNMQNVLLSGSQISESNFTNTDLRDADLSDARAYKAIFDGTDLRGAKLDRLCFRGSSWEGANLDPRWLEVITILEPKLQPNQDLQGLDLSYMCIYDYDLKGVKLNNANLSGSTLAWADLTGANLQNANLKDTFLWTTNFARANLKGAIVTIDQLTDAILCETIMPDGQISNEGCDRLPASPIP